ncbi:MAG TPA: NYN domain-containing protein [Verrucomicrobiae bacterium]|jgi:predicted RNA-binding protein with PIN domain|nr:NYN domain-containing protein [Verrucomicrobiae bacterium]
MPLVRILVDGYSLLHNWQELAPGKARHSEAARDELINILRQYRDAIGTPITIVFDGSAPKRGAQPAASSPELEILYSSSSQTADDLIERAAARLRDFGDVLVVTNDFAERDTVFFGGAFSSSCENFIDDIEKTLRRQEREIEHHNRRERARFKTH